MLEGEVNFERLKLKRFKFKLNFKLRSTNSLLPTHQDSLRSSGSSSALSSTTYSSKLAITLPLSCNRVIQISSIVSRDPLIYVHLEHHHLMDWGSPLGPSITISQGKKANYHLEKSERCPTPDGCLEKHRHCLWSHMISLRDPRTCHEKPESQSILELNDALMWQRRLLDQKIRWTAC